MKNLKSPMWWGSVLLRLAIVLFFLFPIYWIGAMSVMPDGVVLSFPPQFVFSPTLENYLQLFSGVLETTTGALQVNFLSSMLNSFILATGSTLVALIVGVPASYAFARYKFGGSDNLSFTILSVRFAPPLLILIPLLREFNAVGIANQYWSLIWVYLLLTVPLVLWVTRGYFEQISPDLESAYRLDGHNWWQTFLRIALPLAKPGIAAAGLLTFIYAWNNFIFALVLASKQIQPVTVAMLSFITASGIDYGAIAAALMLSVLPTLLIALWAQRYLVQGLAIGATKG